MEKILELLENRSPKYIYMESSDEIELNGNEYVNTDYLSYEVLSYYVEDDNLHFKLGEPSRFNLINIMKSDAEAAQEYFDIDEDEIAFSLNDDTAMISLIEETQPGDEITDICLGSEDDIDITRDELYGVININGYGWSAYFVEED